MLRLQQNVPEIYTSHSRDFQLFCRTYDLVNNAVRFSCESTTNLLDPSKASDNILTLLASRIGFFPERDYNTYVLRCILSAFPYFIKYKGSKHGIEMVVNTLLRAERSSEDSEVLVDSELVYIYTENPIRNEALLRDVLSYMLPIGYGLVIGTFSRLNLDATKIANTLTTIRNTPNQDEVSIIVDNDDLPNDTYTGSYAVSQIVDENNQQENN